MDLGAAGAADHARANSTGATKRWAVRVVKLLAVAYPLALLGVAWAFRYVGEGWWATAVGLYLPRVAFAAPLPFVVLALVILGPRRWLWTQVASAVIFLFVLMGFVVPWPRSARPNAPIFRVLSYNIDSGRGGSGRIVQQIDAYSPDIVFLQEVGNPDDLERLLKARYSTVSTSDQFILATRYPVVSPIEPPGKLPYLDKHRSPRFLRYAIDTPLGPIVFYNVHPVSPREALYAVRGARGLTREILSGRLFRGAARGAIAENFGLRALQVETFSEAAAKETGPVVIAGDTNLPWLSNVFGERLSAYVDGFQSAGWGFGYSFPNDRRPWMRIDRVLATHDLRFASFAVGDSAASDHRCVVAEIQRADP